MCPIYQYLCKCGREKEEFVTTISKGKETIDCKDCGRKAKRVPSLGSFILKGGGWYKDGYK
jgi:putative FmdB family regulatory protein